MRFAQEQPLFEEELDAFYATYPVDISPLFGEMDRIAARHPEWGPCRRKALIYETAAARCDVHLFRRCPFFYEIVGGRERWQWGFGGIGSWLLQQPEQRALAAPPAAWDRQRNERGFSHDYPVLDTDHHCVGYDNLLRWGLNTIADRIEARLRGLGDERQRDFLEAALIGCRSLVAIADRFAIDARAMAEDEAEPHDRERLMEMAAAAKHVPAYPPRTFYEALCAVLFVREALASLEGIGESILGHLDRMLGPYLDADLASGRVTLERATDLMQAFLAITDAKCNIRREPRETSTTVIIGGCDRNGEPVFNEVTRMIVEAYRDLTLVNPKLNARLSPRHFPEYFRLLADLIAAGTNVVALFNDDVIIEANVRAGKAREDSRLYVGGGCQENMLQNTEINSRASIYLNLAHVFLIGFFPDEWAWFTERVGIEIEPYAGAKDPGEFRRRFLVNLQAITDAHIDARNATEREGWWWNPCPLHSATIDDCIDNGRDMMDGGTRYAGASVSLIGVGTLVDSFYAIEQVVFDEGRITLEQMGDLLATDFAGDETLRQYLLHRVPKYGRHNEAMGPFAATLFADLARVTSGRPNTRGGRYEASLFVYRSFTGMGKKTGATPDGRRAGEWLSPGMSPSPLAVGEDTTAGTLFDAVEPLDLTDYPVVAVLDMKLPWSHAGLRPDLIVPILHRFLDAGGSVLQLNVVDSAVLLQARTHPELHPDLVVRVSGYSARFTTLPDSIQEEIIARATVAS